MCKTRRKWGDDGVGRTDSKKEVGDKVVRRKEGQETKEEEEEEKEVRGRGRRGCVTSWVINFFQQCTVH